MLDPQILIAGVLMAIAAALAAGPFLLRRPEADTSTVTFPWFMCSSGSVGGGAM